MIPEIAGICDSLAALTIKEGDPVVGTDRQITVCEQCRRTLPDGTRKEDQTAIILFQDEVAPMNLSSIVSRVSKELRFTPRTNHRVSLASKLVGLSVAIRRLFTNPLEPVNLLLSHMSEARVIQWAVFPIPSIGGADQYRFGDFAYGELDLDKLRSRCERAGSNFVGLSGNRLRGRQAICRDSREVKALDFNAMSSSFRNSLDTTEKSIISRLVDDLYEDIAQEEQREFKVDLDQQQAIYGAAGLGTFSAAFLSQFSAYTQWITVFTRQQRGHGWVVSDQVEPGVSIPEPRALAAGHREITNHLKLQDWPERPLDPWIQSFCHYITAAQGYESNGRIEEALLHLVFGFDLVLGGEAEESLTAILAERLAFLSHRALRLSLKELSDFMRECYNLRSEYVHRGKKGKLGETKGSRGLNERYDLLLQAARAVLGAACFARQQDWCQDEKPRKAWTNRIDVLRVKHEAGFAIDEAELAGLGLLQVQLQETKLPFVVIE